MDWRPADERRTARLNALLRAAGFETAIVHLAEMPGRNYGYTEPMGAEFAVFIARGLPGPEAQAAALHEAAHWALGHADDAEYAAARARDELAGVTDARGPWERDADALAAAFAEELAELLDDPDATFECLAADVARFT